MYPSSAPRDGLALLAEAFRSRRTGVLVVGDGEGAIHVRLEAGQVMALGPPAREGSAAKEPKASDSVQLRLERVLAEIGMRRSPQTARTPDVSASTPLSSASLRERLIASLAEDVRPVRFDDGAPSPDGLVAVSVATEPLILEAVRQMRHDEAVLNAIGDLDQLLVATIALAEERTLTLTEGYLLSRIDGLHSARQVLELVPLDPGDVERTLLGLLLTGRVETRPAPYPRRVPIAPPAPVAPLFAAPPAAFADTRPPEPTLEEAPPVSQATPETAPDSLATGPTVVPVEDEPPVESEPQAEASHIVAEWTNEDVEAARAAVVESVESAEPVEAAPSAAADEALETQTVTIREFERPVPELIPEADEAPGNEAADTPLEGPTVESSAAETPSPTGAVSEETVEVEGFQTGPPPTDPMVDAPIDAAVLERRREVLEVFQSLPLKNHFEVLGVEPGCNDEEVKRAYVALTKRFHPDAQRDRRLEDMHDILEAIFIRVQEAWEVLGEAKSRASYEASSGIVRRPRTARPAGERAPSVPGIAPSPPPSRPAPAPDYVPPEEVLYQVRQLLAQARYWDAIQILESTLPGMEPRTQQHRGRLLLARAYSKNPNWLRRAEETLQQLVREDPTNADAHFELGMIYKTSGFPTRAQAMFRRTLELRPGHKEASAELGIPTDTGTPRPGLLKRLFKRGG